MTNAWLSQAASLTLHLGAMALLSLFVPPADADAETDADDVAFIRHVLARAGAGSDDETAGGGASAAEPTETEPRVGADDGPRPVTARRGAAARTRAGEPGDAPQRARSFGMIGLLAGSVRAGGLSPSPWGGSGVAGGASLWGDSVGDSFGIGGVDLSGVGEGAGGRGEGIGIGGVGTLGHGLGASEGEGFGCGCGHGVLGGVHRTRAPVLRCGSPPDAPREPDGSSGCTAAVNGRLPPDAVQRVVRASFGRFRLCYEQGLRKKPGLEGRVTVNFVIDRLGAVSMAADGGSDLPDAGVVACIVRGFDALSFPAPAGGIVTVVYPLAMSVGP